MSDKGVGDREPKKKGDRKVRTKQRHAKHVVGDVGVEIVRRKLPIHWVARPINPDYGLDLHVEIFEPDDDDPTSANTLGEHLYVQVKTAKSVTLEKITVRSRGNVTKHDPDPKVGDPVEIEVAKFSLDTETLLTVETMERPSLCSMLRRPLVREGLLRLPQRLHCEGAPALQALLRGARVGDHHGPKLERLRHG